MYTTGQATITTAQPFAENSRTMAIPVCRHTPEMIPSGIPFIDVSGIKRAGKDIPGNGSATSHPHHLLRVRDHVKQVYQYPFLKPLWLPQRGK